MTCPICLRETLADPCECGYAFATGDTALAADRARRVHVAATHKTLLGAALLIAIPISIVSAIVVPATTILAFAVSTAGLVAGVHALTRGLTWRRAARRRLERATRPAELPAARVRKS
jgi:hypothetical protein